MPSTAACPSLIPLSNEEMHFKNMPLSSLVYPYLFVHQNILTSATSVTKAISFATPNLFASCKCILNAEVRAKFATSLSLLLARSLS